jgi:uncharacterized protein with GYD domain
MVFIWGKEEIVIK